MSGVEKPSSLGVVVALVSAKDRVGSIVETVHALRSLNAVDRVVVIDDGSTDGTADAVRSMGDTTVSVIRLARNQGKGGALRAGVEASPDADTFLLIDADLAETASAAGVLLEPIADGRADLVIGLPVEAAGARAGFGKVRTLAASGIRRACGFETATPLSGQRAVRGDLLRSLPIADRFGVETAMTIDAVRAGARVVEVPMAFDHQHTGRSLAGFVHRGRQGADIVRALWSRVTTARLRIGLVVALAVLFMVGSIVSSFGWEPSSVPVGGTAGGTRRVVLFGIPRIALTDLRQGDTPVLDKLLDRGALAATSVRTIAGRPTTVEGYASIGAGARIRARGTAADAYAADDLVGVRRAADIAQSRTGLPVTGEVVVPAMAETVLANAKRYVPSYAGALGDALHSAGKRTAVVGSSDVGDVESDSSAGLARPAAVALADSAGSVDLGVVGPSLLADDPAAPSGVRVDRAAFVAAALAAVAGADVTVLDPGELDRVFASKAEVAEVQFETLRRQALRRTDSILGDVVAALPPRTLLIVASLRPPTGTWELTPTVLVGDGVPVGYAHSPSTRRLGLITLTDLTPTILAAVGVDVPSGMIGHALRVHRTDGPAGLGRLRDLNDISAYRERIYLPLTKGYVIFQAIIYLLTILLFSSGAGIGRARGTLEWIVLAIAAFPLATFVFRLIPHVWSLGPFGGVVVIALDLFLVWLARHARRRPLSGLSCILLGTLVIITVDVCTGARLQQASILGYSPHTAARFTGIGNAAFAALAVCAVLWAAIHVHDAPRRSEAVVTAGIVCALVFVADGAPMLGSDVGGLITLAPVFALLLFVLSGRRISVRTVLSAGGVTLALLAAATALDLTRPAASRTHLGRFVTDIGKDDSTFSTTILRKLATNVRVFTGSFWTWVVPIIAITLLFFLVVQRGWERDMARGSALRAGVVASLLAGLLGFAVNDSGSVVTALVFVELGPLITLLALARDDGARLLPGTGEGIVVETRAVYSNFAAAMPNPPSVHITPMS